MPRELISTHKQLTDSVNFLVAKYMHMGTPPPPVGRPNICAIQASGANEVPKYVFNAQAIF